MALPEVTLELNYAKDEPAFITLLGLMMMDNYVGVSGVVKPPTLEQIKTHLAAIRSPEARAAGISIMVIRSNGRIVGTTRPRPVIENKAKQAKVKDSDGYWKIGSFFIHPDYRGKGFGTAAALAFKAIHPKLVYMYEEGNDSSARIAKNLDLPFSHYLYLRGDELYFRVSHLWARDSYLRYLVHKN